MALIKVYSLPEKKEELLTKVAADIKKVVACALNTAEVPTDINSVEVVYCEGVDLIGIDYILEVIAVERSEMQKIADNIISNLNKVYPNIKFSIYFNLISEIGMSHTPRD